MELGSKTDCKIEKRIDRKKNILDFDKICFDYINSLYEGVSGFTKYEPGEKESFALNRIYLTYGEILYPSVNIMIDALSDFNSEDVFYDLGSGIGKVALQLFLKTPVKKSCGIEASTVRHQYAVAAYEEVSQELPELYKNGRELCAKMENFLISDISDATIIYSCCTCFSDGLLHDMAGIIDKKCAKIRYVVSMKQLPLQKLSLLTTAEVECTWDKSKLHIYGYRNQG